MDSNSEIQGYNVYPMLHFHRKFSSSITTCTRKPPDQKEEEREKKKEKGLAQVVVKKTSAVEGEKSNEYTSGKMKADEEGDVSRNEDGNVSTLEWIEA